MAQILVRDLDPAVVERLKQQAKRNHRSLQAEVRAILEGAAHERSKAETLARADVIRALLGHRQFSDSADLIREDRER
jgi:antitoxin FitA